MAEWLDAQIPIVIARTRTRSGATTGDAPRTVEVWESNTFYERNLYAPRGRHPSVSQDALT